MTAKAGIHRRSGVSATDGQMDSRLRGNDDVDVAVDSMNLNPL
jgi:hypothetical protein